MTGARPRVIHLPPPESAGKVGHADTQPAQSQDNGAKPSRIPDATIAFVQHAYAAGADDNLDERRRLFLDHTLTNPHLTLQELALFAGVTTAERARQLYKASLTVLWQASPPELQQQYQLADLSRRIQGLSRPPLSPEHRAKLLAANTGRKQSPDHTAKIVAANTGRKQSPEARARMSAAHKGRQLSPEHRARISEGARKSWEKADIRTKRIHKPSLETRARMSEAQRRRQERRRQQQSEDQQSTQVFRSGFPGTSEKFRTLER